MLLYKQAQTPAVCWPEPVETTWQTLGASPQAGFSKVLHLSLSDELFIAAVANIPPVQRPWGAISWLAQVFGTSRPTVYRLGDVVAARLQAPVPAAQLPAPAAAEPDADTITVTAERMRRTVMTAAFPGRMALRPLQAVLTEAFGQTRSVGFLSELLTQAGQRAGRILQTIDHSPLGPVIVVRDETFFQDWPILLVLEPVSSTILLAHVSEDRTAETWGAALLVAQDQGATIAGLVEDMARSYPKSQKLAEIDVEVQKDTWHVTHQGAQVGQDLQRQALNAVRKVDALEDKLRKQWQDELFFEQYIPAVALEEQRVAQYHSYANLFGHLCDALELVDVRSGEIRDRQTNNCWRRPLSLCASSGILASTSSSKRSATISRNCSPIWTGWRLRSATTAPHLRNTSVTRPRNSNS